MIEGGFSNTALGKMILATCFITDFGTVLALGGLFANFNVWLVGFVVVLSIVLWFMPMWTKLIIERLGATGVSEPEVKFILFVLLFLGGLATTARSEAVRQSIPEGVSLADAIKEYEWRVDGPDSRKQLEKESPALVAACDAAVVQQKRERLQQELASQSTTHGMRR